MKDRLRAIKCHDNYVVVNDNGERSNHGHFNSVGAAHKLIKLIEKRIVPASEYLRESVLRITVDRKYKQKVADKIRKDSNKQQYYNINKGV